MKRLVTFGMRGRWVLAFILGLAVLCVCMAVPAWAGYPVHGDWAQSLVGLAGLGALACGTLDATVGIKNYAGQGGDNWHVSGTLEIESGGALNIKSGGTLTLESGSTFAPDGNLEILTGQTLKVDSGGILEVAGNQVFDAGAKGDLPELGNAVVLPQPCGLLRINIADASGDTDVVVAGKYRVLDFWFRKGAGNGGAGDTITLKRGATAVSNALDTSGVAKTVTRVTTVDAAQEVYALGDTLRVSANKVTSVLGTAYVLVSKEP